MKKIITIILAAIMLLTLSATAFAAGTGSITINNITPTSTYEIYCILDLESYNNTTGAYSYKVNSAWSGFFATPEALAYVAIDGAGYVTWTAAEDDDTVAAFAKLALAYAKANSISPVQSSGTGDFVITGTSGKFSNLPLGYYLVDSTVGALCGLTTTNPNASINAKNGVPTVDKQVKEDSTGNWSDTNTAQIGQEVEFRVTINVHDGAENYVLHDKMSAGLTFGEVTKITHIIPGSDEHTTPTDKYDVVTTGLTDDCTFEVRFTQAFCDSLETNDKIIVYYTATLNENAIIALEGNPNGAGLTFGEENETTWDETKTYAFGFDIVKTDSQNNLIDGAEFKIYDAATGGNEIKVVKDGGNYRPATGSEVGESIVVEDGKVRVVGFDNGTYYLEETVAPAGYNKLTSRQKFIISDANLDSIFNDGVFSTGSGVHVVNKTGNMLPETGGMGTVLFVVLGSIAVLGTGVVLFTMKRYSKVAE